MPTQAERTASARRRLIDAATELIARQGIAKTSVAAIGAHAGMSRGAVNFHFVSKDALLAAVAEEVTADWTRVVLSIDPPLDVALGDTIDVFLENSRRDLLDHPERARTLMVLAVESLAGAPLLHEYFVGLHRRVRAATASILERRQAAGQIRDDVDPEGFSLVIVGLFRGIALQYLLDPEEVDLDAGFAATRAYMLAHLAP